MICLKLQKYLLVLLVSISAVFLSMTSECRAETGTKAEDVMRKETAGIIERQYEAGGIDKIRDGIEKYTDEEAMELFVGYDADRLMNDLARGTMAPDLKGIGSKALGFFFIELYQNMGVLVKITVLVVICALLKTSGGFMSEGAGQVAFYVCYMVMISILLVSLER